MTTDQSTLVVGFQEGLEEDRSFVLGKCAMVLRWVSFAQRVKSRLDLPVNEAV